MYCEISCKFSFVCWLLNVVVVFTCLEHIFSALDLYGVDLPSFKVFKSLLTLPFSIQCVTMISLMFFFSNKCCYWFIFESFFKISVFCNILQFFIIVLVKIGKNWLYVITRGYLSDFCRVSLSVIMLILLSRLIISIYSLINDELYPVLRSYFSFP